VTRIDEWWQRERASAPDLFLEEFGAALDRLATVPSAGAVYVGGHRQDLRGSYCRVRGITSTTSWSRTEWR
jgi:hypothetical protein